MCKKKCRCGKTLTEESKKYSPTECMDCFIANECAEQRRDKEFDAMERLDEKSGRQTEKEEHDLCEDCYEFCSACDNYEDNSQDYKRQQEFAQRLSAYIAKSDTRFFS